MKSSRSLEHFGLAVLAARAVVLGNKHTTTGVGFHQYEHAEHYWEFGVWCPCAERGCQVPPGNYLTIKAYRGLHGLDVHKANTVIGCSHDLAGAFKVAMLIAYAEFAQLPVSDLRAITANILEGLAPALIGEHFEVSVAEKITVSNIVSGETFTVEVSAMKTAVIKCRIRQYTLAFNVPASLLLHSPLKTVIDRVTALRESVEQGGPLLLQSQLEALGAVFPD